ncbi:VOC family protein [Sorangium sp. So ce854]|uniref:VOC domain-containing protein n=1 Tax=Sorangium cellulosum TaxID=56 RepID=A0A150PSX9_SORCE|nr:hypothetical protein BE08_16185 [Sorangium cellulosum]
MQFHVGRLIDHVHLRVADLGRSKRFYRAVLQALGRDIVVEAPGYFSAGELFVSPSDGGPVSRLHLAFQSGRAGGCCRAGAPRARGGSTTVRAAGPLRRRP